jgi:hypothetical protein
MRLLALFVTPSIAVFGTQAQHQYNDMHNNESIQIMNNTIVSHNTVPSDRLQRRKLYSRTEWFMLKSDINMDINQVIQEPLHRSESSVSISGNGEIVAIGTTKGQVNSQVRLFSSNKSRNTWNQLGQAIEGEMFFGSSVSLSHDGKTVAIGSPDHPDHQGNGCSGQVFVFFLDEVANSWVQLGPDINGQAIDDYLGGSVSLASDGRIVAVGAPGHDHDSGLVQVFAYDDIGNSWMQLGEDMGGDAGMFGSSIALSKNGKMIVIGAIYHYENGIDSGQVKVFSFADGSKSWTQLGSDILGEAAWDECGWAVSISHDGRIVAVGSPGHNYRAGRVRVYSFDDMGKSWMQLGSSIDGQDSTEIYSGASISLSSDGKVVAVAGAAISTYGNGTDYGQVRIHSFDDGKNTWTQLGSDIFGKEAGNQFGFSVSLASDGKTVAMGVHGNDGMVGNSSPGQVQVFDCTSRTGPSNALLMVGGALGVFTLTAGLFVYKRIRQESTQSWQMVSRDSEWKGGRIKN